MYDVVVIGGNLSGANAAIHAAAKGANVALVERNKEPFFPAHCGEGIADVTGKLIDLDRMGCAKNVINEIIVNIASPKEYHFKLMKHKTICIFDRNCVEKNLLEKAEKQGVEMFLGVSMKDFHPPNEIILDNNKKINGKVIIDASGIACQVGRRIGMDTRLKPEDIGVCIQSRVESNFEADTIKTWFHSPYAPFGYAWLFPLNEKLANIGFGLKGGQHLDYGKLLKRYINDMTNGNYKIKSTFRACVPLATPMEKLTKDNVMLVGDAARLANSTAGGGIEQAILSGGLAGKVAADYVQGKIPSLEIYQELMRNMISRLRKKYKDKSRVVHTEEKFVKGYRRSVSILYFVNKIAPNLLQGYVVKVLEKDKSILESYN